MNLNNIELLNPIYSNIDNNNYVSKKFSNKFQPITFSQFEHIWGYLGKLIIITRTLLTAAAKNMSIIAFAGKCFPCKVDNFSTRLKLFVVINIPLNLISIRSNLNRLINNIHINAKEEIAFETLSFVRTLAETYDTLTTFVNSTLKIALVNPMMQLRTLSTPTMFAMTGMGAVSSTIQLTKSLDLYKQIDREIISISKFKNKEELKKFLEDKLDIKEELKLIKGLHSNPMNHETLDQVEKLKQKKKAEILRSAPQETVKELKKLFALLDANVDHPLTEQQFDEVTQSLEKVLGQLKTKMKMDLIGLLASFFFMCSYSLFIMGTGGSWPFLFVSAGLTTRIFYLVQEDYNKKII